MIYGFAFDTVLYYHSSFGFLRAKPSLLLMCRQIHSESKSLAVPPYTTIYMNGSSFDFSIRTIKMWHGHNPSHITSVQLGRGMVRSIKRYHKGYVNSTTAFATRLKGLVCDAFPALELVLLPKSLEIESGYYNEAIGFFFTRAGVLIAYV